MLSALHFIVGRLSWAVVAVSLGLVVLAASYGSGVFAQLQPDDGQPVRGAESTAVAEVIKHDFKARGGDIVVLLTAKDRSVTIDDSRYRPEVQRLLAGLPQATQLTTYYSPGGAGFVSRDRSQVFASLSLPGTDRQQYELLSRFQDAARSGLLEVKVGGQLMAQQQISHQIEADLAQAEVVTLPILVILLLVFFRSVVAAVLPVLLGGISIVGGLAVTRLLTEVTDIQQYAINVITVLGLGLSVDYSLLMVSRFREELARPSVSTSAALRRTLATSGHTIFFSGLTVMMSLLALLIFPIGFLRSVALGGVSAVVVAMVAALVLLPALLALIGRGIDRLRVVPRRRRAARGVNIWSRLAGVSLRLPLVTLAVSSLAIIACAAPLSKIVFTSIDYRVLPETSSAYIVGQQLQRNFVDQQSPVLVLAELPTPALSADGLSRLASLTQQLADLPGVSKVVGPVPEAGGLSAGQLAAAYAAGSSPELQQLAARTTAGRQAVLSVYYSGGAYDAAAQRLVGDIRALQPASLSLRVGGMPATHHDMLATISRYLPTALVVIAVSMYVLLMLLLRSVWLPLQAVVINSFALLAAFGVLVSIFQFGWLTDISWLRQIGGLDPSIPVLIGAIAFGLSMDYAAFLYGRMREEYDRRPDPQAAIVRGLGATGPIISAAALVFFVVVMAFGVSSIAIIQQVGVGLSVAVLVDAFVVRLFFVPAVMRLFGRRSWAWPAGNVWQWLRRGLYG